MTRTEGWWEFKFISTCAIILPVVPFEKRHSLCNFAAVKVMLGMLVTLAALIKGLMHIYMLNTVSEEAYTAFEQARYEESIAKYHYLIDSLKAENQRAALNLSHAYYRAQDTTQALPSYSSLASAGDSVVRSLSQQQLGVMYVQKEALKEALAYFKNALKADPYNEDARYNYELIKRRLESDSQKDNKQDKKEQKQEQNKDQKEQQKDQQKQDQQQGGEGDKKEQDQQKNGDKEQDSSSKDGKKKDDSSEKNGKENIKDGKKEKGDEKEQKGGKPGEEKEGQEKQEALTPEEQKKKEDMERRQAQAQRFQNMDMSEEKAQMILNATKQAEKQYLQQLKKTPTKPKESDKPDW